MTQKNPRILVAKAIALKEAADVLMRHQIQDKSLRLPRGVTREMVLQEYVKLPEAMLRRAERILK